MLFDGKSARMEREREKEREERERRRKTYLFEDPFPRSAFSPFTCAVDFGRACFASEDELLRQERLGKSGEET